jgi:hypothetical protein
MDCPVSDFSLELIISGFFFHLTHQNKPQIAWQRSQCNRLNFARDLLYIK